MKLSVVIPACNEESLIGETIRNLHAELVLDGIDHEILIVNDHSTDNTETIIKDLSAKIPECRYLNNQNPSGFGFACRRGLDAISGETVAIYMADGSDQPQDLVRFFRTMISEKVDCVFGTRFSKESRLVGYPLLKLILNRLANTYIRLLFGLRYNDVTNAFKMYRREVIAGLRPLLSNHFNLTVELPLKAIVRGYSYVIVPNAWINRQAGESKLKIKEMGSRYLFIVLYCLIEKWLSRGDYHRKSAAALERHSKRSDSILHSHQSGDRVT